MGKLLDRESRDNTGAGTARAKHSDTIAEKTFYTGENRAKESKQK